MRDVLQRGRGAHDDGRARRQRIAQGLQSAQGGLQVGAPDIAPRHDAGDDGLAGQGLELIRRGGLSGHEVEGDPLDSGAGQDGQRVAEGAVAAGHEHLGTLGDGGDPGVGIGDGGQHLVARHVPGVADQRGLVELNPLGAGGPQVGQKVPVGVEHVVQAVQRTEAGVGAVGRLGQEQVGHRADDDGPRGLFTGPQRLQDLGDRTIGRVDRSEAGDVADGGVGVELGHEVVVVGVEPLGHLQGGALALAAGCGEEARQGGARELAGLGVRTAGITGTAAQVGEALRQSPESGGDLKDLVVIGEICGDGRSAGQSQPAQTSAGGGPQGGGALAQPGDVQGAFPVGLDVAFELAVRTDAGVAEDRGGGQGRTGGRWGQGERHMRYFLSFLGVLVGGDAEMR